MWYLIVVCICTDLMTSDTEDLFTCLLTIGIYSLDISVQIFCPLKNWIVCLFIVDS